VHLVGSLVLVCWILFWGYWLVSAFSSKKNLSYRPGQFIGIRLIIILLALILFRLFNVQNGAFWRRAISTNGLILAAGFVIFVLGLGLAVWARLYLGRNWGMPMSRKLNPELVTAGPYRYIRHPIYSGILLALLATALTTSLYWLLICAIVGVYFIYSALMEERLLTKEFPRAYPAYKASSKMLVPFIF